MMAAETPYGAELSMPHLGDDPVAHRRRRDRSDRPSSGVGRNPNIAKLELALPATSPSAVSSRCTNPAARAGLYAPRPSFGDVLRRPLAKG